MTDKQERHLERRKNKQLTQIQAEEIKMEKKKIEAMDNEDWDGSDIEINEQDLDKESENDSFDSQGEEDADQKAKNITRKTVKLLGQ